jgi:hypothetical protein
MFALAAKSDLSTKSSQQREPIDLGSRLISSRQQQSCDNPDGMIWH